jgi:hypothetical protein
MRSRSLVVVVCVIPIAAISGCGGSNEISAASLQPRLLSSSELPGLGLQRKFDWSDPVNLVGEGVAVPQTTQPSEAVKEFKAAGLKGAAGETFILTSRAPGEETISTLGVAKFGSAASAERVRDWMHSQDRHQPCYGPCIFAPYVTSIAGIPNVRYVIQSGKAPPPPPGAPKGAKAVTGAAPANYLAEFTIGQYLYWAILHGDSTAKARFEKGLRLYYAHAKQAA